MDIDILTTSLCLAVLCTTCCARLRCSVAERAKIAYMDSHHGTVDLDSLWKRKDLMCMFAWPLLAQDLFMGLGICPARPTRQPRQYRLAAAFVVVYVKL